MMIEVRDLHKSFGSLEVLKGVNCSVEKSEVVCVIGTIRLRQEHFPALPQPPRGSYQRHHRH